MNMKKNNLAPQATYEISVATGNTEIDMVLVKKLLLRFQLLSRKKVSVNVCNVVC